MQDKDGLPMIEFRQGYVSMNEPSKALEKLVVGRQLRHGGNPVLRWMANNCAVEIDAAGNVKPSKKRSTERIDGVVALIMAVGLSLTAPPQPPPFFQTVRQIWG